MASKVVSILFIAASTARSKALMQRSSVTCAFMSQAALNDLQVPTQFVQIRRNATKWPNTEVRNQQPTAEWSRSSEGESFGSAPFAGSATVRNLCIIKGAA
jgi:hypothetical protein